MVEKNPDLQVFIDNGHDTLKCCQVNREEITRPLNHFEIPTTFIKELVTMKKEKYKEAKKKGQSSANLNFKFHKKNMTLLLEDVKNQYN